MIPEDDSWMYELWAWADEHNVPDLHWVEDEDYGNGGYWSQDCPRNRDNITDLTRLNLEGKQLTILPESFGKITK